MKHFLFLILYIFFAATSYTQPPNFNWVQRLERATGLPFDESYFIGTDAERNVYVAGNFHFTIDLDPGAGVSNVTSAFDNVFVSKFNSAGSFVWGKHVGKNDKYTVCKSLSVDAAGNVYTTGYFNGKADFDPGPDVYNLTSTRDLNYESNDIFISKLDANGNFRWAKQVGASGIDIGTSVNADIFGNVYITGYFSGAVDFDPGPASVTKGSGNVVNCFISKYDAAGNFRYAKVFEGNHHSEG
ncbi:MAG TPA: SBBP repeat-containing protein, partial [Segetibacter sp.]